MPPKPEQGPDRMTFVRVFGMSTSVTPSPTFVPIRADFLQCCSPSLNGGGGWGIFNALFGWQNSATYGSVISYNVYWIAVILGFIAMRFHEKRAKPAGKVGSVSSNEAESASGKAEGNPAITSVRSVES